jgi:FKBP-type peptidyl-prolyl cis-trans isomerase SlyD
LKIARHTVASIEYRLTSDNGEEIDSSEGHGPLSYVHGTDSIVPGLESELEGKQPGDELKVRVPPDKGYGERDESLVHSVPRKQFPAGEIEVGMQVEARTKEGRMHLTVVGVEADSIKLDANHPARGHRAELRDQGRRGASGDARGAAARPRARCGRARALNAARRERGASVALKGQAFSASPAVDLERANRGECGGRGETSNKGWGLPGSSRPGELTIRASGAHSTCTPSCVASVFPSTSWIARRYVPDASRNHGGTAPLSTTN